MVDEVNFSHTKMQRKTTAKSVHPNRRHTAELRDAGNIFSGMKKSLDNRL